MQEFNNQQLNKTSPTTDFDASNQPIAENEQIIDDKIDINEATENLPAEQENMPEQNVEQFDSQVMKSQEQNTENHTQTTQNHIILSQNSFENPGLIEHRTIRRRANALGFAFGLTVLTNLFLFPILSFVFAAAGLDSKILYNAVSDPFYSMVFQIFFSIIAFVPTFLVAAKMSRVKVSKIIPFTKAQKGTTLPFLLIGFGFLAVANILSNIFSTVLKNLGISNYEFDLNLPSGVSGFIISAIAAAVVPALVEEFAYRGVFLGLLKEYGEGFCIIASSVMFALMHGNLSQIPFAFIVGLVLGFIRVKSGSIIPAMLLHFLNNFVSVVLSIVTEDAGYALMVGINTVYFAVAVVCISVGLLLLKPGSFEMFRINRSNSALYESQKSSAFYAAPMIIVAYILTFLLIVSSEIM